MADFILHRKISVDTYPFPEGAFQIYGGGKFYNGFSIGETKKLSVVNTDGVLKFSREAANANEMTSVILGTIPQNNKTSIYIDIASPLSKSMTSAFKIGTSSLFTEKKQWTSAGIHHTTGTSNTEKLQAGGVLSIYFQNAAGLNAIPDLCSVRAIWAL